MIKKDFIKDVKEMNPDILCLQETKGQPEEVKTALQLLPDYSVAVNSSKERKGSGSSETFTIRKMSGTVGVERIFPINLPAIQKIEVNKKGKVRRARIFYFRNLTGKKARIKEERR